MVLIILYIKYIPSTEYVNHLRQQKAGTSVEVSALAAHSYSFVITFSFVITLLFSS